MRLLSGALRLLTDYCQLQALPSDVTERPAAIAGGEPARATAMRAIWAADIVTSRSLH